MKKRGEIMEDLKKPEVFVRYYENVYKDLYRYALYILKNPQDAEDVVSETVMDAYAGVEKLRDPNAFKNWIFAILSNKCRRKLKEYVDKTVELPEELWGTEESSLVETIQVRTAFASLSEEEQQVISLKVFGGYKSQEIGRLMDLNENTVRSKIQRGLQKMRALLA